MGSLQVIVPHIGILLKTYGVKAATSKSRVDKARRVDIDEWEWKIVRFNMTSNQEINTTPNVTLTQHPDVTFDIATVVAEKCNKIYERLKSDNTVSYLQKLKLSRKVVKYCLVEKYGAFPSPQAKEDLAQNLIHTFPSLKGLDGTGYVSYNYL